MAGVLVALLCTMVLAAGASTPPARARATAPSPHCASAAGGRVVCRGLWRQGDPRTAGLGPTNSGYTATQLQQIYGVTPTTSAGTGPVVAVIDVHHYDRVYADLAAYRRAYGLPPCARGATADAAGACFREVDEHGRTTFTPEPAGDDWSGETALDLDMVSAICPSCRILLVSASNDRHQHTIEAAIRQAVAQGARYVSMSFGIGRHKARAAFFKKWPDVVFTAASGDVGYRGADWPSEATGVISVGGVRDAGGRLSAWNDAAGGTNGGCAAPGKKGKTARMPIYQQANRRVRATCGVSKKAESDLSAIADPVTGVANYVNGQWWEAGGTSAAAPIIAALYADAGNHTDPEAPYANPGIEDVTSGSICTRHVSGRICRARKGWDGPTGLGMPTSPAAVAVAVRAPELRATLHVRGRAHHALHAWLPLPTRTRDTDGTGVSLASVTATVLKLPAGLHAHVRGHRLKISGTPSAPRRGRARLILTGTTADGRRTEAVAGRIHYAITRHGPRRGPAR